MNDKVRGLMLEFLRYAIVGGIAFLADFGALVGAQELYLKDFSWGIYCATVIGFIVGLMAVVPALSILAASVGNRFRELQR